MAPRKPASRPSRRIVRRKVNASKPSLLPNMPLDILLEIFGYLGPQELLFLSRTSKSFRGFLFDARKSDFIWKNAIRNIGGLPESLPDMSQLAWINLLFSPHCHACLKKSVNKIFWEFGVRYCPKCEAENTMYFRWDTFKLTSPRDGSSPPKYLNAYGYRTLHVPEVEAFKTLWKKIRRVKREALIEERTTKVTTTRQRAAAARDWFETYQRDRQAELEDLEEDIIEGQLKYILSRLRELGWGDEIDKFTEAALDRIRDYCSPSRPLTEGRWIRMRKGILTLMQEITGDHRYYTRTA